jgi:DNA-binding HxlR family transcriptional regulator
MTTIDINDQPPATLVEETGAALCLKSLLPVNDILELTSGKWRLHIIMALMCVGTMRFKQLQRELPGISGKVLSGELKELEVNQILERKIYDTYPVTVEYSLTEYGRTLEEVVNALRAWGLKHRDRMME